MVEMVGNFGAVTARSLLMSLDEGAEPARA
jgi:hypothetical protein